MTLNLSNECLGNSATPKSYALESQWLLCEAATQRPEQEPRTAYERTTHGCKAKRMTHSLFLHVAGPRAGGGSARGCGVDQELLPPLCGVPEGRGEHL